MTTYISRSGAEFTLPEFDVSRIYSPSQKRQLETEIQVYWDVIASDKKAAAKEANTKQAEIERQETEQEEYERHIFEDNRKKALWAEREIIEIAKHKEHEEYLKSLPSVASVVASDIWTFISEISVWSGKKYTLDEGSLLVNHPSFYSVSMSKGAK